MSFQTQQSRTGVNLKKDEHLSAKQEFDSIDFNKSSPTTQMNPRVRIAAVGMAGNNPGTIDSDLERGKSPTYSARASYALPAGRVGASAIYSRLKYVS
jgi:hypothetical protein